MFKLATISMIFMFSALPVNAEDALPDVLSAVSSDSVQVLSQAEASNVRGEWRVCRDGTNKCKAWRVNKNFQPTTLNGWSDQVILSPCADFSSRAACSSGGFYVAR
ncbi:MAG: hypothetical protein QJT81_21000 [Candidatus Thiothrix putei]|uniref:Uncharacterized protein n=1 Tax=Candidatus Thiothrix putei TaxID=3080811 RepID=A0AA95HDF3_9GAMM|nr:MAG: hypothetical protein QJT81_21000 [Candidatus Thiothrix putei]